MSKQCTRCSREIRLLTNELSQMRRELQFLQWFVAGVVILLSWLCLWMIRMRRLPSNGRTASTIGTHVTGDQCSAKSDRVSSGVTRKRRISNFWSCLKRRSVSVRTNTQMSTPSECDSHSAPRGLAAVPSQQPSAIAWLQRSFRASHLFGVPLSRKMDSTDQTSIPGISRAPTDVASVAVKIATTAKMMCVYVLMVETMSCVDHAVHVFLVVGAFPMNSPCVDIFQVDRVHSRDRVEQRVRRTYLMNRPDVLQLGGYMTNPEDPYTSVITCDTTDLPLCQIEPSGEQIWKNAGQPPPGRWSCGTKKHDLFWLMSKIWPVTSTVVMQECF